MTAAEERQDAISLVLRLTLVAFLLPLLVVAIVWIYYSAQGHEIERIEWRHIVFFSWTGTILVLLYDALTLRRGRSSLRRGRRRTSAGEPEADRRTTSQVQKWEDKKTTGIMRELVGTAVLIPLLSAVLVEVYFFVAAGGLNYSQWRTAAVIIWIAVLICLCRVARRARRDKISL
ncbi:MAG TPA: hypothetical protein PLP17_03340 [Oligoflexia bacterium]|nr:hypothetical protein [Oligoflexia bacterium]